MRRAARIIRRAAFLALPAALAASRAAATMRIDPGFGYRGLATSPYGDAAIALAVQADGKIVAAGTARGDVYDGVLLVRFYTTGAIDTSFGDGGFARLFAANTWLLPSAMASQSDGRLVVAGSAFSTSGGVFFVARFLAGGVPDPTFGGTGVVTTAFPGLSASATALAIQTDGRIVVAGGAGVFTPFPDGDYAAARYNTDGTLDATFGDGGLVTVDLGGHLPESAFAVVVEHGGRIVLGGISSSPLGNGAALVGLDPIGALDPGFGSGGKVFVTRGVSTDCRALALQRDGKIVAAGGIWDPGGMLVMRFQADGAPDAAFGDAGAATLATAEASAVRGRR
jgi:uncharacterized delta-60 repeat protein